MFLSQKEFTVVGEKNANLFKNAIFNVRSAVLNIISNFIHGKKEPGFAKALLIGYTDELDKQLVQSYTNTGVVHIIAISGLHLGIIFTLLNFLVVPLQKNKASRFVAALIVIAGL